jgi:hypothetical protein
MLSDREIENFLPKGARAKFRALTRKARAAMAAARALYEDIRSEEEKLREILLALNEQRRRLPFEKLEEPAEVVSLREKIAELKAIQEPLIQAQRAAVEPLHACRDWIGNMHRLGVKIEDFVPVEKKNSKASDPAKAISDQRDEISALDEKYQEIEKAPAPVAELKARAIDEIKALAVSNTPGIYTGTREGSPIDLDDKLTLRSYGIVRDQVAEVVTHRSTTGFLLWALRDVLIERVTETLDTLPIEGAITDADREKCLNELAAAKLEAERIEELLILKAEAAGMKIERRGNADPRALLMVHA